MQILHYAGAVVGIDYCQHSCVIHFGDDVGGGDDVGVADVGTEYYHDNTDPAFASGDGYNVLVVDHDSLLQKMIRQTALECSCSAASCAYDEQSLQGRLARQVS